MWNEGIEVMKAKLRTEYHTQTTEPGLTMTLFDS